MELSGVEGKRNGEDITVAGIVVAMRAMRSRKGDRWAILTVQDMTGVLEVLAFPEAFARLENVLKSDAPLLLRGRVNVEEAGTRVSVQEAQLLDQVAEGNTFMRVRVDLGAVDEGHARPAEGAFRGFAGAVRDRIRSAGSGRLGGDAALEPARAPGRTAGGQGARDVRRRCGGGGALSAQESARESAATGAGSRPGNRADGA